MAALLGAGGVSGLEAVRAARVAGEAGDVLERGRVGFQVGPMTGGGGDARPGLLGLALDVAAFADVARDLGVRRNQVRTVDDPVEQLLRLGLQLERVAGVAD